MKLSGNSLFRNLVNVKLSYVTSEIEKLIGIPGTFRRGGRELEKFFLAESS